jgi:predicted RNase H-like HicB family nuclease
VKKDARRRWVAGCPQLDIFSQGATKTAAKAALDEAVKLWIESCVERDTLDTALRQCGFHPNQNSLPNAPIDLSCAS